MLFEEHAQVMASPLRERLFAKTAERLFGRFQKRAAGREEHARNNAARGTGSVCESCNETQWLIIFCKIRRLTSVATCCWRL